MTPDRLELAQQPGDCLSWKFGPDGPVGPNGYRLPSNTWCGVALFAGEAAAKSAFEARHAYLPHLDAAVESWHARLVPVEHRGECNHLDRTDPGKIFETGAPDPGGPLLVMTTAGFNAGAAPARLVDFRIHVDKVRDWLASIDGNVARQVFTPHTVGDDGVTFSIWRDDAAMINAMYMPGTHRTQMDRYKSEKTADRTSFTRFRALGTTGCWQGVDPIAMASMPGAPR
jgi:hypothetical protein